MRLPGFNADASIRRFGSQISQSRQEVGGYDRTAAVRPAQYSCADIPCPDGRPSGGEYPDCHCCSDLACADGSTQRGDYPYCYCFAPPDGPARPACDSSEPLCPPPLVSYGHWPYCGCKDPDQADPPRGEAVVVTASAAAVVVVSCPAAVASRPATSSTLAIPGCTWTSVITANAFARAAMTVRSIAIEAIAWPAAWPNSNWSGSRPSCTTPDQSA